MRRIVAAGATDVGRVRQGNEDALLVCDSVFAVADGMGGHLAGEVASSKSLEPLRKLEGQVFSDAPQALTALREAVVAANQTVAELAQTEPSYRGMGTTLTAALVEGRRLHVAHVGDSRAYLLRGGQFSQLTDDHTLVQHLVNEGQITREEAASHPQRSMITRAIGISPEVEVDSMTVDLEPDDQLLLCSDGLTGVVRDEVIAGELLAGNDPQATVDRLVELANSAGGPDNVTAVLLRYEDPAGDGSSPSSGARISINGGTETANGHGTAVLTDGGVSLLQRDNGAAARAEDPDRDARQVFTRRGAVALTVVLVIVLGLGAAAFLLSQSYYVGTDAREVVIYQGVAANVGPIPLSRVVERSGLTVDDVPEYFRPTLQAGLPVSDLDDARRRIETVPLRQTVLGESPATPEISEGEPLSPEAEVGDGTPS